MTVGRNTGMEELALSARMAWGRGRSGDGAKGEGAESRPGLVQLFIVSTLFCFFVMEGDVWVVGGEASSASRGLEAENLVVYMLWPQSGRMQYTRTCTIFPGKLIRGL
jgi:hypothetical protein